MPDAAVSRLQNATPMLTRRVRIQRSASAPSGRPTAAYTNVNAVPRKPSAVSDRPNSRRIGSPSAPGSWRSKKFNRLMTNSSASAKPAPRRTPGPGTASGENFKQSGSAHAAADAHGHDDVLCAEPPAGNERMRREPLTAHAVRMPDRDRTAVDVQPLIGNTETI